MQRVLSVRQALYCNFIGSYTKSGISLRHWEITPELDCMLFRRTLFLVRGGDHQERSRAWAPTTHPLGQASVLIKGRAVCDYLLPDVLPVLTDPAEVTVTAILVCLITLKAKKANLKTVFGYKATSNHDLESLELLRQFGRLWNKKETISMKSPYPGYTKMWSSSPTY